MKFGGGKVKLARILICLLVACSFCVSAFATPARDTGNRQTVVVAEQAAVPAQAEVTTAQTAVGAVFRGNIEFTVSSFDYTGKLETNRQITVRQWRENVFRRQSSNNLTIIRQYDYQRARICENKRAYSIFEYPLKS